MAGLQVYITMLSFLKLFVGVEGGLMWPSLALDLLCQGFPTTET